MLVLHRFGWLRYRLWCISKFSTATARNKISPAADLLLSLPQLRIQIPTSTAEAHHQVSTLPHRHIIVCQVHILLLLLGCLVHVFEKYKRMIGVLLKAASHSHSFAVPIFKDVQLSGGSAADNEGGLEVYLTPSDGWVRVCPDGWVSADAEVVCRQLGYETGQTTVLSTSQL